MASKRFATLAVTLAATVLAAGCGEPPTQPDMAGPPRAFVSGGTSGTVRISEIHYDNVGTDEGEAIEIAGPAGTDLTGWSVVLYNGSNGAAYNTRTLSGTIPATCDSEGVVVLDYPVNGSRTVRRTASRSWTRRAPSSSSSRTKARSPRWTVLRRG